MTNSLVFNFINRRELQKVSRAFSLAAPVPVP
jgi:hypothetical protein